MANRRWSAVFLTLSLLSLPLAAQSWDDRPAKIHQAGGAALTLPSAASPTAVVARYLADSGRDASLVSAIASVSQWRSPNGLTHAKLEQRVNGRVVYGAYGKAALNADGQLLHLIENFAAGKVAKSNASVDERGALQAALARLHPSVAAPGLVSRAGGVASFARGTFFHSDPTVESVLVPMTDGSLRAGWLVTTWSEAKNLLHETLVSGDGAVLNVENRTNTDSYNVFVIDPPKSGQTVVTGPGSTTQSPNGWLGTGAQSTVNITGNNAHAYLDTNNNGAPDPGGSPVTSGDFLTVWSGAASPSTASNQEVAIQNLFYLNNRIHDVLYDAGFVEAEGNFQESNFGRGGRGSDSVNAEGQDGGGTDNANFATPRDGSNPRMQMYLWTGRPSHQVVVGSNVFAAAGAEFGPALTGTGVTGNLALASPSDACTAIAALSGIAIVDRGTCTFVEKVKNAQNAGASGVIVVNNAGEEAVAMAGTDATITIPSVGVGQTDGATIKTHAAESATIRLTDPPPNMVDGDLDADIVFHEYGHGLTWRMIGRMDGPMAGAIGEGMSDVLALVMNGDDTIGEYAYSDPIGIRSAPYTNFPRTYASVTGSEVHYDGEIYGAIGWDLRDRYLAFGLTTTDLLRDLVQGMTFTPAKPTFEMMRDGILAASSHDCLVWQAFARYGVGQGAKGSVKGSRVTVTESFTVPAGVCPP